MRDKSQLDKIEARYFTDKVRIITWSLVNSYDPEGVISVGSAAIFAGPKHAFWGVQESVTSFKFTQSIYVQAMKEKKMVIFHRIDIDVEHLCTPIPDAVREGLVSDSIADAIRLLAMDEVIGGLDTLICNRLFEHFTKQNFVTPPRQKCLHDWFMLDPFCVGDAIFEVLPGLQILVWRAPAELSRTARFVAIRNIKESVACITHFVGGLGLRTNDWVIAPDASIHG